MSKRTIDTFFKPPKKPKPNEPTQNAATPPPPDTHPTYPIPTIAALPTHLNNAIRTSLPSREPKIMNNQPDLDCLYYQPLIPRSTANELFRFLRAELPFYRVVYFAKRGGTDVEIRTPRFTTVFGVDESCQFVPVEELEAPAESTPAPTPAPATITGADTESGAESTSPSKDPSNKDQTETNPTATTITSSSSSSPYTTSKMTLMKKDNSPIHNGTYGHKPRPIPSSLQMLKTQIESITNTKYNFVLVNYYATGEDSIAFHSDDERFLGFEPAIASLSLGGEREFLLKHKPVPAASNAAGSGSGSGSGNAGGKTTAGAPGSIVPGTSLIKLPLQSGDMILMRGRTQSNWLHSIPKRKGKGAGIGGSAGVGGRINITFRRAIVPGGTDNYYHYNVGSGGVWRWDEVKREMVECRDGHGEKSEERVG